MAKTKISEFSATPANNTDIDGINIAEGCAPSGINDAIRELMAQLKDWQSGTSNDPYVIGSSGSLTLNQGTANGVPYLNGSKVVTSGSALTFDGTNFATTGSVTSAGSSNSGNLAFTGTGNRITGDFTNGTVANRVMFQTSTANSGTNIGAVANGTVADNTGTGFVAWSNSDPTASQAVSLFSFKNLEARLTSGSNTGTYAPLTFYTGGSERMRVDTSGNVGIGTSSPNKSSSSTALTVNTGTAANYSAVEWSSNNTLNYHINANDSAIYHVAAGTRPWIVYTNGSERMRIDSSGNLGIGTSAPGQRLEISNASTNTTFSTVGNQLLIRNSGTTADAYARVDFAGGSSNNPTASIAAQIKNYGTGATELVFGTFNTGAGTIAERARIDSSGNLLVGTTSNANGGRLAVAATWPQTVQSLYCTNAGGHTAVAFLNGGTQVGRIDTTSTATSYVTSSDYRLKHDIQPMTGALAKVAQLKPVTYKWNIDNSESQGFIAHELQEVVSECVVGEKDAVDADGNPQYQGIDTSFLVATLTAAIQEQQALIASQSAIITALTARVEALESN